MATRVFELSLLLCLALKSASAADPILYQVDEEVRQDYRIGNIISGANLDGKYNQTVLNQLRFTFLTQSQHRDLFYLGEHDGNLMTAGRLDRDAICPRQEVCDINLDIAVQPVQYFQAIKITVRVRDLNDNDPKFPEQTMKSAISEANVPGILFPIPSATDPDSPKFSIKRYEFYSDTNKFELRVRNSSDGTLDLHLALKEMLDREEEDHYEMTVIAYDGGSPPRTGSVKIEITVLDMNDNSPRFLNTTYSVNVPENTEINSPIIKVTAVDPDAGENGEVSYSFAARTLREYGDTFGIEPITGDIYLTGKLDYETVQQYHLTVQAQDRGPDALPTSVKVTVNVVDVNDHAPQITINALNENENAQVPEDSEVPFFVAHISVFDPDQGVNGQFNCTLDDRNFQLYKLFETEFKVMAMVQLDREEQAVHNIRITCSDNGYPPLTALSYLTVVVVDKNDNGPRFTQNTYFATVTENNKVGSYVLQVSAVDQDEGSNADVEYSLEVNAQEAFTIDPQTGVIRANTRFDRENIQNLEFKVTAADHGTPPRTATTTILVTVLDMDDNSPRFTQSRFVMSVEENLQENSQVGQLTAQDGDLPPFNEFYFYIAEGQSAAKSFNVDRYTGMITTKEVLDREDKEAYSMNVVVKSKNPYQPNDTAQVIIYVDDVNDNSPIIDFPNVYNRTVLISNQVPIGYVVTRIVAHDIDSGKNAKLMYTITDGNEQNDFVIGTSTGDVFVNSKFENIGEKVYTLIIMVKDLGIPQKITVDRLKIVVNESIPFVPLMGAQGSKQISDIQLIVIICVILGTVVVATLLIAAIVVLKCKERKSSKPPQYFQRTDQSQYDATDAKDNCDTKVSTPATMTTVLAGGGHEGQRKPEVLDHTVIKADFDDEDTSMSQSTLDPAKVSIPHLSCLLLVRTLDTSTWLRVN